MRALELIVVSGLPGCGKSAIAHALGRALRIPVFEEDRIEAGLVRAGLAGVPPGINGPGAPGWVFFCTLIERQLELGQSVVVDAVVGLRSQRDEWRALCERLGARWRPMLCVCSDPAVHRARLEGSARGIPGWPGPSWDDVERAQRRFEGWTEPVLTLDAVDSLEYNIARALAHLDDDAQALLRAMAEGARLKDHRDIEGAKAYLLHADDGGAVPVRAETVALLVQAGLIDSNKKFPAATYWLTGRAAGGR